MDSYSSDVNTIFAFVNIRHKFNQIVNDYFNSIKNHKYVLLSHVKNTFIFTYNDSLKKIGEIIISTVNKVREILSERKMKKPPSDVVKNAYLKAEMQKLIQNWDKNLNNEDCDYYKNMLLSDFPLIELLNDEEELKKFDSVYVEKAEEIVNNKIKEFIAIFNYLEDSPRLNLKKVKEWYIEIKKMKIENFTIFIDYDDEDIKLSSQYITYCEDRKIPLNFSSTDENLVNSLKTVTKEKNIKCGRIKFLLEN